jgi:hypothetical protein
MQPGKMVQACLKEILDNILASKEMIEKWQN